MRAFSRAAPTLGYGLAVLSGVYLACLAFLISGLGGSIVPLRATGQPVLGLALMAAVALMLTGISINRRWPLTHLSSAVWIWLMAVLAPPRLAVFTLGDRWSPSVILEAAILVAAVAVVLFLPPRVARAEGGGA